MIQEFRFLSDLLLHLLHYFEIGAMVRQCLNRRIPDRAAMCRQTGAWAERRNREKAAVNWRFTTADARVRLRSLYPSTQ